MGTVFSGESAWEGRRKRADGVGRYTAQNFSGAMARSAKMTIVEAEEIVPVGSLDPNFVHLPGILYVPSPSSHALS